MRRGFTLLEMLIVLAVMAILGGLAVANLNAYIQSSRLNQALQEVAEALRSVGNRALTESRGYTVTITTGANSRLEWANSEGPVGSMVVPNAVQIVSLTPSGSTIQYAGRGFPLNQYRLGLQIGSRPAREVVLLPTGKVVIP
ncbi:pilus assembly FimT family protein [Meiothermus hypogaeus]|uniref:Uncharacterized protein n=2 Tax=Meiothermus hypogaeus TaxID=884155 RepID=A0A511R5Q0_9DEIN|nr:prepilin-type N-terminal cleavage/methylation domain-containing protein [Meiothermus hypogaeus]RIH74986.1 type II secretion system protein H [Meiothermus hypogaeus]GEM84905.1 hypothetical protein MHY01S_30710 [Meiothermus hypogaeus NBRC 106114]